MKYLFLFSIFLLSVPMLFAQTNKAKELVSKMTLEEKAKLVVGNGFRMPGAPPRGR